MSRNLQLLGAHRGGRQFVATLAMADRHSLGSQWTVADPHEDRAMQLAQAIPQRFPGVHAQGWAMTAQEAIVRGDRETHVVMATDTVSSIQETLPLRGGRPTTFQLVGRGPGGNGSLRLGIQGTLLPDDPVHAQQVQRLLGSLAQLSEEASSRVMTQSDPLMAQTLAPLRDRVTALSAGHVLHAGRDPWDLPSAPLSMVVHGQPLATTVIDADPMLNFSQRQALACMAASAIPLRAWGPSVMVLVVLLIAGEVELLSVAEQPRRRVVGQSRFSRPAQTILAPAMFTD